MAENYPKSKLKRRKFLVEGKSILTDSRRETTPPGATGRDGSAESGSSGTKNGSPFPAAAHWSCHQPPAEAKNLWALVLSAVEGLQGGSVPDLPLPSVAKPSSDQDGWRWCDLRAEVDPFPQSSSSLSLVQQDPASSSFTEQRADPQTETAPPRTTEGRRSDRSQKDSGSVGEEEEEQKHGGRGELQSCPMCLQEFPSGFSQMDCDSHLAQCLSDMNVDVTW